jgi:hypothetical protein
MKIIRITLAAVMLMGVFFLITSYTPINSLAQTSFEDVPPTHWAYEFVNILYNNKITSGCSKQPFNYCPNSGVTRGQMAVFIQTSIRKENPGFDYGPSQGIFSDVQPGSSFEKYIEQMYKDGITSGCMSEPRSFCPDRHISRAEMAVFLLKSKYGRSYTPPAATGTMFSDVPAGSFAAAWIEQLAREKISSGCGGNKFCPSRTVTRAEMSVFITKAFFDDQIVNSPPPYSTSYYVKTTNVDAMYDIGCLQGERDKALSGSQESLVILAFGKPRIFGNGVYGARLYGPLGPVTMPSIVESAKAFGLGYAACVDNDPFSRLEVALGTSNYVYPGEENQVTYEHGRAWAAMVNEVNNWFVSRGLSGKVNFVGASDMELSWNSPQVTKNWVNGYDSMNNYPLYNFGAVEGCPTRISPGWRCANSWTQEDVWYISYGNGASYPVPEIYATSGVNARQWAWMSVYGYTAHSTPFYFKGVLTTYQACQQRGGCSGIDNTPIQGWQQLYDEINSDSRTKQLNLKYSTDIKWYGE